MVWELSHLLHLFEWNKCVWSSTLGIQWGAFERVEPRPGYHPFLGNTTKLFLLRHTIFSMKNVFFLRLHHEIISQKLGLSEWQIIWPWYDKHDLRVIKRGPILKSAHGDQRSEFISKPLFISMFALRCLPYFQTVLPESMSKKLENPKRHTSKQLWKSKISFKRQKYLLKAHGERAKTGLKLPNFQK